MSDTEEFIVHLKIRTATYDSPTAYILEVEINDEVVPYALTDTDHEGLSDSLREMLAAGISDGTIRVIGAP